jgi:hypothetical protein
MDQLRATVFAQPSRAPDWPWIVAPTTGQLQGMAVVDGEIVGDAAISLFRNGAWERDLSASADGWFGAVELPPGAYTILVRNPAAERAVEYNVTVHAGLVANGP